MKRNLAFIFVFAALFATVIAQESTPQPSTQKRGWMSRLNPFSRSDRTPDYKDARLRGLVVDLEVSPEPVKLSEVRQLEVKVTLRNRGKRPIVLDFPDAQRIEILLKNPAEEVLTKWSDNHAFAQQTGTLMINPQEHILYRETIATRDLTPNKVFTAEAFFPKYPELRGRHKFLTAP